MEKEVQQDSQYRQQLEQERRDHEMALRLARESNGQVEDSPPLVRKYVMSFYCRTRCIKTKEIRIFLPKFSEIDCFFTPI